MRIFVTGATGVVGRRAVPLLVAAGHHVTAVGRTEAGRRALEAAGASAAGVDIFSPSSIRQALAGHHAVVNLATHIPRSSFGIFFRSAWRENDRIRRVASAVLVEAAIATGVGRFVQESSPRSIPIAATSGSTKPLRSGRPPTTVRPSTPSVPRSASPEADAPRWSCASPREYFDSLARAVGAPPPRLLPAWLAFFMGSVGETLARSLRISNRRLRTGSGWAPRYPSVREGWPATVRDLLPAPSPGARPDRLGDQKAD